MIHDKTQPIRIREAPLYAFPCGFVVRQVHGDNWESLGLDGKHIAYLKADEVDYESSLAAEFLKSRSIRQ
jgi:hypothetical protein